MDNLINYWLVQMSTVVQKKAQENMNQKLALVIKSGKYKLGKWKFIFFETSNLIILWVKDINQPLNHWDKEKPNSF